VGDAKGLLPQALAIVNQLPKKGRQEILASLNSGYPASRFDPVSLGLVGRRDAWAPWWQV
jgi:hypothetical protein